MKATVVIPTYNRAARLRGLLECLAHQEGDHLARVVVCDDGSSDETAEVARSFMERLPLVYAFQEDLGFRAGQARNLGVERAIGEVVIFVDDDMLVSPTFVREHVRAHEGREAAQCCALGLRYRASTFVKRVPSTSDILGAERDDRIADLDGGSVEEHEAPWTFVYSCNFSVTLGGPELRFDDKFHGWGFEDLELGYRLFHAGYPIFELKGAPVLHIDDPAPRDPFRCEVLELPPTYDSYVLNFVYFMDKYPADSDLARIARNELRWYVEGPDGHWVKNGYENDVEYVIDRCRRKLAGHSSPQEHAQART